MPPESDQTPEPPELHAPHRREHGEPMDRLVPVSMVVMVFIAVLFFWAGVYITRYNGNFDPFAFDETQTPGSVAEAPEPPEPLPVLGAKIFKRNCTQCHQADGMGVEGSYPPLHGSPWVTGAADRMASVLLTGMSGDIEVLGRKVAGGNMPAFRDTLNDRQIAAVMTYLRTREDWGHKASEVTPEAVAALREKLGKREPWSPQEILKLYSQ